MTQDLHIITDKQIRDGVEYYTFVIRKIDKKDNMVVVAIHPKDFEWNKIGDTFTKCIGELNEKG